MHTLAEGLTEIVRLIADTFRLWWKNLLPMVTWYLLGYVCFRMSIIAAVWLSAHQHRNIAIGLFSAGMLMQLVALAAMIRTCAKSLYRWKDATAASEEAAALPQRRLLELLSVTMLPMIAVWSAWGFLDDKIQELGVQFVVMEGIGGDFILKVTGGAWKDFIPAIVVLLVLRRVLESVDDRWPNRPTKFAQIWCEGFFLLLAVIIVPQLIVTAKNWVEGREFWFQTVGFWGGLRDFFASINIPIPDGLEWLWSFTWGTLWPLFAEGVGEPLTWLAITAVIFGQRALSASALVAGTRLEARLGGRPAAPQQRGRTAALASRAPGLVFGGLKEKFLPTLNAFRMLVRVGPVFLGVVCLVYTLHAVAHKWFYLLTQHVIGDHGQRWDDIVGNGGDLLASVIFETLRIALLAAAFDQCLSVGAALHAEKVAAEQAEAAEADAGQRPVTA